MPAAADGAITTSAAMEERLAALAEQPGVVVETIGTSVGGTPLRAVRVTPPARLAIRHRILFVGAQHGNEHAGKEAILDLLDDLAEGELTLPPGVELHAIPMANPDGVDADQRRNGNDFDLNRDHVILSQPETRALHAYAQRVKPTVIVDCHEFTRDSGSYADRGWGEWPLIMMDGANSPLLPGGTLDLGLGWVEAAEEPMADAGFAYQRYLVGGPPPENELRPSTLDADDARNGLSFNGGLGFIIESGIKRSADDPQVDLPERVAAYRVLLDRFLTDTERLEETRAALEAMAAEPAGDAVVTNALWARTAPGVVPYPVVDLASGETVRVPAFNFATDRAVKTQVATPLGYVVIGPHAEAHAGLLDAARDPVRAARWPADRAGRGGGAARRRGGRRRNPRPLRRPPDHPQPPRRRGHAARGLAARPLRRPPRPDAPPPGDRGARAAPTLRPLPVAGLAGDGGRGRRAAGAADRGRTSCGLTSRFCAQHHRVAAPGRPFGSRSNAAGYAVMVRPDAPYPLKISLRRVRLDAPLPA